MNTKTRALLGALTLAGLASTAHAELVSASGPAPTADMQTAATATSLLDSLPDLSSPDLADSLDARKSALAARALALPASAAPSLWTLVTTVQAQQRGSAFQQLDTQLKLVQQTAVPTQVPLPAPLWLLVMGALGFVGSRLGMGRKAAEENGSASPVLRPA